MPEFCAGTYPYAKRQAIADAVQAGLLPHTQQTEGDSTIRGAVTVIVRVVAPQTEVGAEGPCICGQWATVHIPECPVAIRYRQMRDNLRDTPPEVARGCATKVDV